MYTPAMYWVYGFRAHGKDHRRIFSKRKENLVNRNIVVIFRPVKSTDLFANMLGLL